MIEVREEPLFAFAPGAESDLWGRAKTQWLLGDWDSLAAYDISHLENDARRAELATLAACAQLQKGEKQSARKYLAAASRWKCAPAFMVRALVASSEACMARYHRLSGRGEKATALLASSAGAFGGDGRLAARTRLALEAAAEAEPDTSAAPPPEGAGDPMRASAPAALTLEEAIAAARAEESPWAKPGITSYAQNFEDVMLWRALGHVENGFYIDIGAQHPVTDSVSKAFYERGWRGIHVEPVKQYADLLRKDRPDEVVIEAAVSDTHGEIVLHNFPGTGLSTLSAEIAAMHGASGRAGEPRQVTAITLDDLFALAGPRDIHWLKIDVEGSEKEVLNGWRTSEARPWVVCIECTIPNTRTHCLADWETALSDKGYLHSYSDGLNRFYTHKSQPAPLNAFAFPPNVFDGFRPCGWAARHQRPSHG